MKQAARSLGRFENSTALVRSPVGLVTILVLAISVLASSAVANPYLPKPTDQPVPIRVATCAVSGGFIHLYAALEYGLFDKYGIKASHVYIRGSGVSLTALASDEIQFLYCAANATIPGIATGIDAKLVAATLVGVPHVVLARRDIKGPEDLKGKTIGIARVGDLSYRLTRAFLKKVNLSDKQVTIRAIGGSVAERYTAMVQDIVQSIIVPPPHDVHGKRDGFNVLYRISDLNLPFIYSSLHTNSKTIKERPWLVQRLVAATAEAIYFVEKNPEKAMASVGKVFKIGDKEVLVSAYDAFATKLVNRRLIIPPDAIAEAVQMAREEGTTVRRNPDDLYENSFAANLEKSGFLKELWGGKVPQ